MYAAAQVPDLPVILGSSFFPHSSYLITGKSCEFFLQNVFCPDAVHCPSPPPSPYSRSPSRPLWTAARLQLIVPLPPSSPRIYSHTSARGDSFKDINLIMLPSCSNPFNVFLVKSQLLTTTRAAPGLAVTCFSSHQGSQASSFTTVTSFSFFKYSEHISCFRSFALAFPFVWEALPQIIVGLPSLVRLLV